MKSPRFIILADNRTGSTVLNLALQRHSKLDCVTWEPFSWTWPLLKKEPIQQRFLEERNAMLREIYGDVRFDFSLTEHHDLIPAFNELWKQYHGFKVMRIDQIDLSNPIWNFLATQQEAKIIFLVRKNKLEQFVSHQLAKKTLLYHLLPHNQEGKNKLDNIKITIDIKEMLTSIRMSDYAETYLRHFLSGAPFLEIAYEDIAVDIHQVLSQIQKFIGIPEEKLPIIYEKSNTQSLRERVTNLDEVNLVLKRCSMDYAPNDPLS